VLGDAARLAARDARAADPIEQGRLPVVHVAQDGDDRLSNGGHDRRTKKSTLLEASAANQGNVKPPTPHP
jgi:hypothetical protein